MVIPSKVLLVLPDGTEIDLTAQFNIRAISWEVRGRGEFSRATLEVLGAEIDAEGQIFLPERKG